MEKEKINILIDNSLINCLFFNYLHRDDYEDIESRLSRNASLVCGFFSGDKPLFAAVLDFGSDTLHVREFAGNFSGTGYNVKDGYKMLNHFCGALARVLGYKYITFHGERNFYRKMFASYGFAAVSENDYLRGVH